MTVVIELLRIKEFRESQAETEVRRRRSRLAEVARKLQQMQSDLVDFQKWSQERELASFNDMRGRMVRLRDLERLRAQISEWRNHERNLEQGVEEAERQRRQAAQEMDTAVGLLHEAGRQKNKFTELVRIYSQELQQELERREELETEEFRPTERGDDEWEQDGDDTGSLLN
ncbi:MAG: YscO family type III secretion system apparatus protein [Rhodospirillales bacterium]|nr:YscO family type III secretion system apparatus protein [Rhodospirillales bacterium]